jgi:hypothetical protein
MWKLSLSLAAFVSVAACSSGRGTQADDPAILESILEDDCCVDRAILQDVTDTAALSPGTRRRGYEEDTRNYSKEIREAIHDLYERSASTHALPDSVSVSGSDRRVGADSARRILARFQRENLRRLPDSSTVVLISTVGYSDDRNVAVVRIIKVCGFLCGGIDLRAVRRHPGGWVPAEHVWSAVF